MRHRVENNVPQKLMATLKSTCQRHPSGCDCDSFQYKQCYLEDFHTQKQTETSAGSDDGFKVMLHVARIRARSQPTCDAEKRLKI